MRCIAAICVGLVSALWNVPCPGQSKGELPNWFSSIEAGSPSPQGHLPIMLAGSWNNSCAPRTLEWEVDDRQILLTLERRGMSGICLEVITPWKLTASIEALPPGTYSLWAQLYNVDAVDPQNRRLEWGPELVLEPVTVPEPIGPWWLSGLLPVAVRWRGGSVRRRGAWNAPSP